MALDNNRPHVIITLEVSVMGFWHSVLRRCSMGFELRLFDLLRIASHRAECHGVSTERVWSLPLAASARSCSCQHSKHNLICIYVL